MSGRSGRRSRPVPEEDPRLRSLPGWPRLVDLARGQAGLLLQRQAEECAVDAYTLLLLTRSGRLVRLQRGVYRVGREADPLEPLALAWLWTGRSGVFSHRTALVLHGLLALADGEPVHLTVPTVWPGRGRHVPALIHLHTEDLPAPEVSRVGAFPVVCWERALQHGLGGLGLPEIRAVVAGAARLATPPPA